MALLAVLDADGTSVLTLTAMHSSLEFIVTY